MQQSVYLCIIPRVYLSFHLVHEILMKKSPSFYYIMPDKTTLPSTSITLTSSFIAQTPRIVLPSHYFVSLFNVKHSIDLNVFGDMYLSITRPSSDNLEIGQKRLVSISMRTCIRLPHLPDLSFTPGNILFLF